MGIAGRGCPAGHRFNRTFMELKCIRASLQFLRTSGFNRTFMELKFVERLERDEGSKV